MVKFPTPNNFFREFLEENKIKTTQAAKDLGIGRSALHSFISGKSELSLAMAKRISIYTDTRIELWLQLKAVNDLHTAKNIEVEVKPWKKNLKAARCKQEI